MAKNNKGNSSIRLVKIRKELLAIISMPKSLEETDSTKCSNTSISHKVSLSR